MDVPPGFDANLILVLNLIGTFVFGLSGALAATRARLDVLGVLVMASVVGLAGGVMRDLLIGIPPATIRDWRYLAAAGLAGLVCFWASSHLQRFRRSVLIVDAFGLGLFAVTGATKAVLVGMGVVPSILLGLMTGVGGGLLRDVLLREVPTVLREGLYAVPALLAATITVVAQKAGSTSPVFPVVAALACVGLRLAALRWRIRLPRPRKS